MFVECHNIQAKIKDMKRIFTLSAFAISILFYAQEAIKTGELLKNEATISEMQKKRSDISSGSSRPGNTILGNSGNNTSSNRNPDRGNTNNQPRYQWNQNYGYSEVFLRIPERGYFTVEIGDQQITNASGKFRFFDLGSGRNPISIYENGFLIYRTQLRIANNTRMVLDFFTNKGLYLLDSYPVQGQMYGFNEWDDVWNNPYNNNSGWNNQPNYNYGNVMNKASFQQFLSMMKRNASFDNNRKEFITQQLKTTQFTTGQIVLLLKEFSFDNERLEMAKRLYRSCVDRENYYLVTDAFSFESSRRDLLNFISNSR